MADSDSNSTSSSSADARQDEIMSQLMDGIRDTLDTLHSKMDLDLSHEMKEQSERNHPGYKVIFIGSLNVGKTSLITRYVYDTFDCDQANTVGLDFLTKKIHLEDTNKTVKLQIWDTGGQERFDSVTRQYTRYASAVLVVYDITDSRSFEKAIEWIDDYSLRFSDEVVMVLVGNKSDLRYERQVSTEIAEQKVQEMEMGLMFMETSAKTGYNVEQLFLAVSMRLPDKPPRRMSGINGLQVEKAYYPRSGRRCRCLSAQEHHHHYYYNDVQHHPAMMGRSVSLPSRKQHNIFEDDDFCIIDNAYMRSISDDPKGKHPDCPDGPPGCIMKFTDIVSEAILKKPPELDDVYELLKHKSTHWSDIGREFRLHIDFRDELHTLIYLSAKDKLERVIHKWMESESIDVTWNALVAVLINLEFMDIVRKLREFLMSPDVIEKYTSKLDFHS